MDGLRTSGIPASLILAVFARHDREALRQCRPSRGIGKQAAACGEPGTGSRQAAELARQTQCCCASALAPASPLACAEAERPPRAEPWALAWPLAEPLPWATRPALAPVVPRAAPEPETSSDALPVRRAAPAACGSRPDDGGVESCDDGCAASVAAVRDALPAAAAPSEPSARTDRVPLAIACPAVSRPALAAASAFAGALCTRSSALRVPRLAVETAERVEPAA